MTKKITPNKGNPQSVESKMSEALLRSGYVMESRIVHSLVKSGFFVEPNQRMNDPSTGKSREIDLVAELWDSMHKSLHFGTKVTVNIRFVCEAKNNLYPIVLLTELPYSPNLETWDSFHEGKTGLFRNELVEPSFFDFLTKDRKQYTQYCSFKPKKTGKVSEWLAWHPDDFHADMEKIITYCKSEAKKIEDLGDDYHRLILFMPVVILAGDLYEGQPQGDMVSLTCVDVGFFMNFGMHEGSQSLSMVLFVTEKSYLAFFDKIIRFGKNIEDMIVQKLNAEAGKP